MNETDFDRTIHYPPAWVEPKWNGQMIELRAGWYSKHRAGGWRQWFVNGYTDFIREAPTLTIGVCVLGFTLDLVLGWPQAFSGKGDSAK